MARVPSDEDDCADGCANSTGSKLRMGAPFGNLGNPLARLRGLSRNDSFGDGGASSADDAVRVDVGDGDGGGGRGGALAVPTTVKRGVAMRRRAPTTAERQEHRRLEAYSGGHLLRLPVEACSVLLLRQQHRLPQVPLP